MSATSRTSVSGHQTFIDALAYARRYMLTLALDVALLLSANRYLAARSPDPPPPEYRSALYGTALAALVFALVAAMVHRACRDTTTGGELAIAINWHDLFRATHTGRIISAVLTMVAAMRMRDAWLAAPRGGALTTVLTGAVLGAIASTAALTHWHARARAVYMEVGRLRRVAKGKRQTWH